MHPGKVICFYKHIGFAGYYEGLRILNPYIGMTSLSILATINDHAIHAASSAWHGNVKKMGTSYHILSPVWIKITLGVVLSEAKPSTMTLSKTLI